MFLIRYMYTPPGIGLRVFKYAGGLDTRRLPNLKPGSKKYTGYCTSGKGRYKASSFPQLNGLPVGLVDAAVRAANNSLGKHTRETYQSVKP